MRGLVLLALVAAVALAAIDGGERRHHRRHYTDEDEPVRSSSRLRSSDRRNLKEKIDQAWADYKEQFDKSYDEDEESDFMNAFVRNVVHIEEHNKQHRQGTKSFEIGINHLADLPMHKFKKLNGFRGTRGSSMVPKESSNASSWVAPFNVVAPLTVDWREKELVTPVKNQGMCGSCWAFSATGALEGQHAKQTGKLVSLSEQNLVDCSKADQGCDGGLMDNAFQYIRDNHGIDTEESYPYKGRANKCHFNKRTVGADDTGFVDLRSGDEEGLKLAIATVGPISVAIDAGHRSFQLYKKGVYYEHECSSKELDHGVLLVGYGTDPEGGDYWLIKNSWGEGWGEKGYIRIARNKDNHCGVATIASYPLV